MNKIDQLFSVKREQVLNIYFTAGYPRLTDTPLIVRAIEEAGADMIEIGFPFSDPVADGEIIQKSSHRALQNGMNLDLLFEQLEPLSSVSPIPKILMGYYNTVYQYGMQAFISRCVECGIDGVILPDLPPEIYQREYQSAFFAAGLHFICLVSPQTPPERAAWLASLSRGFLYLLSASSTTGNPSSSLSQLDHLPHISPTGTLPTLIGFGIHDRQSFIKACEVANGAIIGSRFIRELDALGEGEYNREEKITQLCRDFVKAIRGGAGGNRTQPVN